MQNYPILEVLVIDDGSTDDTAIMIQPFLVDKRLKYIYLDKNRGRSAARNVGLELAGGDFIMFLDSDDYLEQGAINHLISLRKANPKINIFAGAYRLFTNKNNREFTIYRRGRTAFLSDAFLEETKQMVLNIGNVILHKDLVKEKRFDESLDFAEDWLFLLNAIKGESAILTNTLISNVYRHNDNSAFGDIQRAIIKVTEKNIKELDYSRDKKYIDNFLLRQLMAYNRLGNKIAAVLCFFKLRRSKYLSPLSLWREFLFLFIPSLFLITFRNIQLKLKTYLNSICNL